MAIGRNRRRQRPGLRYTRIVVPVGRALTSLVLVTALAASPALVSLCLVACVPGSADAAVAASTAEASAAEHAHHAGAASTVATAVSAASAHETARLDGECHDCCVDATTALDASQAGERAGAVAVTLAPTPGPAGPAVLALASATRPLPPLVFPPAPVRASLVLRI